MKYLIYLFAIIVLLGLNLGLFPAFNIKEVGPNLLFLMVVVWALEKSDLDFYFIAFFCGLFLDFYSGLFLGSFTFSFALLVYLLHILMENFIISDLDWKYLALVIFCSMLFVDLFLWGYNILLSRFGFSGLGPDANNLARSFPVQLFYNLAASFPVFLFVDKLKSFVSRYVNSRKRRNI